MKQKSILKIILIILFFLTLNNVSKAYTPNTCTNIKSFNQEGNLIYYCDRGQSIRTPISGEIVIFTNFGTPTSSIFGSRHACDWCSQGAVVNGVFVQQESLSGLRVNAGDELSVRPNETFGVRWSSGIGPDYDGSNNKAYCYEWNDTGVTIDNKIIVIGESPFCKSDYSGPYNNILNLGYKIVEVMGWDDDNGFGANDFNDGVIIVAVKEEPPPPACNPDSDVTMSTNPNPAFVGGNISINAVNTGYDGTHQLKFNGITDKPCNGATSSPGGLYVSYGISNCTVNKDAGTYSWTINYLLFNQTGTGASNSCSKSMEYEIIERPGYLITSGGDTYLHDGFNLPSYNFYARPLCEKAVGKAYCMSEYFFAYKNFNYQGILACKNCSLNKYNKTNYTDINDAYLKFDVLKNSTIERASLYGIDEINNPLYTATNPVKTRIFDINHSLTIPADTKCNNPDIFFIRGDLIITPDFVINNYGNNAGKNIGCLFIVNGDLIIKPGLLKGINKYDLIHGFFILTANDSKIVAEEDGNNLIQIVGGVVSNNGIQELMQRKGKRVDGFAPPSEYIVYEGARYISIFGNLFVNGDLSYNIYEGPFINTFKE